MPHVFATIAFFRSCSSSFKALPCHAYPWTHINILQPLPPVCSRRRASSAYFCLQLGGE